jgi:hypothetical protein
MKDEIFYNGYNIWQFILLYLIGSYISKYFKVRLAKKKTLFFKFITCTLITYIIFIITILFLKKPSLHIFWYDNPLIILGAIYLFIIFQKLEIRNNYINQIASSVLSVYLVQEGAELLFYRDIYNLIHIFYNHYNIIPFIIFILIYIIILFAISIIIDKLLKFIINEFIILSNKLIIDIISIVSTSSQKIEKYLIK